MQENISSINNALLWNVVQGNGIPIVLIHGGPGSYDYLEPLGELVNQDCFQIIRYEQRGSGRSERKGPYTIETFIEDLEQLRIQFDFKSWVLCGHSWGASLALAYSAKYFSRVRALIYISGTGINPAWHTEYRLNRLHNLSETDKEEYRNLQNSFSTLKEEEKIIAKKRLRELSLQADLFNQANFDRIPRVDEPFINNEVNQQISSKVNSYWESKGFKIGMTHIQFPSLFIHGQTDPRPAKYVNELSSSLPNSIFSLIPDAGHYPWLDNPTFLKKRLHEFLVNI